MVKDLSDFGVDVEEAEEAVEQSDFVGSGEITDIYETTNVDYFENNEFEEKGIFVLEVTLTNVKEGFSDDFVDRVEKQEIDFEDTFSKPKGKQSWVNPQFGLTRFKKKYGEVPCVGLEVDVRMNDNGFYEIILEEN